MTNGEYKVGINFNPSNRAYKKETLEWLDSNNE